MRSLSSSILCISATCHRWGNGLCRFPCWEGGQAGRVGQMATIDGGSGRVKLKGICPRGNNKVVIILFRVHNRCLFLMLELY
jgi:hypothetical protein